MIMKLCNNNLKVKTLIIKVDLQKDKNKKKADLPF